jgi:hypothetical protein
VCAAIACALAASAVAGPCQPTHGSEETGLVCGSGINAAHVIANTLSPSRRIALAWRVYKEPPGVSPGADKNIAEGLFIRLRDGAVLGSSGAIYRDPANTNHFFVAAAWSADSRFMLAAFDKPSPSRIDVYTLGERDDALTGPIDLAPVVASAIGKLLTDVQDAALCEFAPAADQAMTIDNRGEVQVTIIESRCATKLSRAYDVRIRVKHDSRSSEPSELAATVLSVAPSKAK